MKSRMLEVAAFTGGACVMIYELAAARMMGPYFGTSLYVWTSVLGIIMLSLALGYHYGGRLADKKGSKKLLSRIFFGASVSIAIAFLISEFVFSITQSSLGIKWGSFFASVLILLIPNVLLGMIAPIATRLKLSDLENSGGVIGNIYAISTIGSIAGTFITGFILLPFIGIFATVCLCVGFLLLISIMLHPRSASIFNIGIVVSLMLTEALLLANSGYTVDENSYYGRITVYEAQDDENRMVKYMRIDNSNSSAQFIDSDSLVNEYLKFYRLAFHYNPNISETLMLGGAAYIYPQELLKMKEPPQVDVVEIDPVVTRIAREEFRLQDHERLTIYHEDARVYLNNCNKKYDVVYGDAFHSLYSIPFHLTTVEFAELLNEKMNENGIYILNLFSALDGPSSDFIHAEYSTLSKVFDKIDVYQVYPEEQFDKVQNLVLVCFKNENMNDGMDSEKYQYLLNRQVKHVWDHHNILTDNKAPVEYYLSKAF